MRPKIFLLLLLTFLPSLSFAQRGKWSGGIQFEGARISPKFGSVGIACDLIGHYLTDRARINLRYMTETHLLKEEGEKDYETNHVIGANFSYDLNKEELFRTGVQVGVATSGWLKSNDWKYNYYEAKYYVNFAKGPVKPQLSLGGRYYHSIDTGRKNRFVIVFGIGFVI